MSLAVSVTVKWHDRAFTRHVRKGLGDNLEDAAVMFKDGVVADITRTRGSYVPPVHSKPGERPFWITREVANSFDVYVDRRSLYAMVFSDDPVARYLEYGVKWHKPRPYFLRAFFTRKRGIAQTMCRPIV